MAAFQEEKQRDNVLAKFQAEEQHRSWNTYSFNSITSILHLRCLTLRLSQFLLQCLCHRDSWISLVTETKEVLWINFIFVETHKR